MVTYHTGDYCGSDIKKFSYSCITSVMHGIFRGEPELMCACAVRFLSNSFFENFKVYLSILYKGEELESS